MFFKSELAGMACVSGAHDVPDGGHRPPHNVESKAVHEPSNKLVGIRGVPPQHPATMGQAYPRPPPGASKLGGDGANRHARMAPLRAAAATTRGRHATCPPCIHPRGAQARAAKLRPPLHPPLRQHGEKTRRERRESTERRRWGVASSMFTDQLARMP